MWKDFRRRVAGILLGDDTAFFTSKKDAERMRAAQFMDVSDDVLGAMFRHFWTVASRTIAEDGEREGFPFAAKMRSACVLYLASEMNRTNAESADYSVSGSIDGGKTMGAWAVRIEADPDYDSDDGRPEKEERDGKITYLRLTTENPGFEEWRERNKQKRAQGMSASGQDPQGLEAKPASPVRQDAPQTSEDNHGQ